MSKDTDNSPRIPPVPAGTGAAGRRLWRGVLADYDLDPHELELLTRAVRVADVCDRLQAVVDAEGEIVTTRLGETKAHPALVELRAQSILLARLIVALRVPLGEAEDGLGHGQRRTPRRGLRGVYGSTRGAS